METPITVWAHPATQVQRIIRRWEYRKKQDIAMKMKYKRSTRSVAFVCKQMHVSAAALLLLLPY